MTSLKHLGILEGEVKLDLWRKVMGKIQELLNSIQQAIKVEKTHYNGYGDFWYRKVDDILKEIKPLLGAGTITMSDKVILVGDRYYIESTATLTLGEEAVSTTASAREIETKKKMDESQLTGVASAYARKTALCGLLGLDDEKDVDSMDPADAGNKPKASAKPKNSDNEFAWGAVLKKSGIETLTIPELKEIMATDGVTTAEQLMAYTSAKAVDYIKSYLKEK